MRFFCCCNYGAAHSSLFVGLNGLLRCSDCFWHWNGGPRRGYQFAGVLEVTIWYSNLMGTGV